MIMSYELPESGGRCRVVDVLPGEKAIMQASAGLGGCWYLGDYYVTHVKGSKQITYLLREQGTPGTAGYRDILGEVKQARQAALELGVWEKKLGWQLSNIARSILQWCDLDGYSDRAAALGIIPQKFGYQRCQPCEVPDVQLWDISSAYYQIARRAKTPICNINGGRVSWQVVSNLQQERWQAALSACENVRPLRLRFIGVAVPSVKTAYMYAGGKKVKIPPSQWKISTLAALAVRITYELCQMQADESLAYYANTDCVITDEGKPLVWEHLGIPYKEKCSGDADIVCMGAYQVGKFQTRPYQSIAATKGRLGGEWWQESEGERIKCRYYKELLK